MLQFVLWSLLDELRSLLEKGVLHAGVRQEQRILAVRGTEVALGRHDVGCYTFRRDSGPNDR